MNMLFERKVMEMKTGSWIHSAAGLSCAIAIALVATLAHAHGGGGGMGMGGMGGE